MMSLKGQAFHFAPLIPDTFTQSSTSSMYQTYALRKFDEGERIYGRGEEEMAEYRSR